MALEESGIHCWMALRNIKPGEVWAASVIEAIKSSQLMVLVYSSAANDSQQVVRELELAVNHKLMIIPLRIEDVSPSPALEYYIQTSHWLDAFKSPIEEHLPDLTCSVKDALSISDAVCMECGQVNSPWWCSKM